MITEEREMGSEHHVPIQSPRRRMGLVRRRPYSLLVAVTGIAVAGVLASVFIVSHQRASDEHLTTDALQREELRDGWRTLGAAAALEAQTASAPTASPAPPTNTLIVNVQGQPGAQGPRGPQGAPGQPGQPGQAAVVGSPGAVAAPSTSYSNGAGSSALPNVLPTGGYGVPVTGYGVAPAPQGSVNGSAPTGLGQASNNVPGSTSNPALPGNSGNSTFPNPGASYGSTNNQNPTSNIPSGVSNLPTGSSNLPSGVP